MGGGGVAGLVSKCGGVVYGTQSSTEELIYSANPNPAGPVSTPHDATVRTEAVQKRGRTCTLGSIPAPRLTPCSFTSSKQMQHASQSPHLGMVASTVPATGGGGNEPDATVNVMGARVAESRPRFDHATPPSRRTLAYDWLAYISAGQVLFVE